MSIFQNHRRRSLIRYFAALLVVLFSLQDLAWAAPAPGVFLSRPPMPRVSFELPASAGMIDGYYQASPARGGQPDGRLILLIQDAHANGSAQLNAARILQELLRRENVRTVFTEADRGNVSLNYLQKYFSTDEIRRAADPFVRKGELKGTEYLSATSDLDFTLQGIESRPLYDASLEAYAEVVRGRSRALSHLDRLARSLRALEAGVLNDALSALQAKRRRHAAGELSTAAYAEEIWVEAGRLGLYREPYRSLASLRDLSRRERSIDFKRVAQEAEDAMALLPAASRGRLRSGDHASAPQVFGGRADAAAGFYAGLEEEMRRAGTDPARGRKLSSLQEYFGYLAKARRFEALKAVDELERLESEVFARLARTESERYFIEFDRNVEILGSALRMELTPSQFERMVRSAGRFDAAMIGGFVNHEILRNAAKHERSVFSNREYDATVAEATRFYRLAQKRDRIFVDRMLDIMERGGE